MKRKTSLIFFISTLLLLGCTANTRDSKSNAIASLFENAKKESQSSSIEETSSLSNSEKSIEGSESIVSFIDESESQSSSLSEANSSSSDIASSSIPSYEKIDVDLTIMNSTMVYSQVLNMLEEPNLYIGKIVKMAGPFRPFGSTDPRYCFPAILIADATACCATGIEFLLYNVPLCSMSGGNGYPLYDEEAIIVGRFETYLEGSDMYIHLVDALWLK